jgi:hypothetical protein
MPSQILHIVFGEDVIAGLCNRLPENALLNAALEKIGGDYHGVFALGCQGPDIFYHSRRLRPVALEYGALLHRRDYGTFAATLLKTALGGDGNYALRAYALGFMTHAVLDRACHPYIIYRSGKEYHAFFERIIDVLMLEKLRSRNPVGMNSEEALAHFCENPPAGLKELIALCLAAAFPERVKKDRSLALRIDNALADSARFYRMTSPAKVHSILQGASASGGSGFTYRSLNFVYPENLSRTTDFLNLNHNLWHYPYVPRGGCQKDDNRSFLEIYAGALETAVDAFVPCVMRYMNTGVFPFDETTRAIGNDCLSIQDEDGKPCTPNLHELFPFDDVLKQQAKIRGISGPTTNIKKEKYI